MVPVAVSRGALLPGVTAAASPQSSTCTSPNSPSMMLSGFRSRWITPLLWAKATASQTLSRISRFSACERWSMTSFQVVPFTSFMA
jgi:hypothetical protein